MREIDCLAPAGVAHAAWRRTDVLGTARFERGPGKHMTWRLSTAEPSWVLGGKEEEELTKGHHIGEETPKTRQRDAGGSWRAGSCVFQCRAPISSPL